MSNLNALFSTSSKTSGSRASANRVSASRASANTASANTASASIASASTAISPRLIKGSSGSSIQSFGSDDSITPLSSVSIMRSRNDEGIILIISVFI